MKTNRFEKVRTRFTPPHRLGYAWPVLAAVLIAVAAQSRKNGPGTTVFMRAKLELSQKILEGLALEDFPAIAARSEKLSSMSKDSRWQLFQNPDYERFSQEFRRNVDAVTKAARDQNLDSATLAYVKTTMNCIECHKFVRGNRVASLSPGILAGE